MLSIGCEVVCPESLWINAIHYATYFKHGNGGGRGKSLCSIATSCTIVGEVGDNYLLVINKNNNIPFGSLAGIGVVFSHSKESVNKWNEEYSRKLDEVRMGRVTLCETLEKAKLMGLL